ncbi:MAG: O-antigen ligase family protein [Bacteroidales bacterium]|nr:O-antigen ligase family protein [Bacteroidales bacterium]
MIKSNTNIHSLAYFVTLVLVAMSLPLSKFAMSVTEFMLLGLWLWSGFSFRIVWRFFKIGGFLKGFLHFLSYFFQLAYHNLVEKFTLFFKNRAALIFSSIYFLHLVGMLLTADFDYALKDLRIKLPLLLFPVVFSSMEQIEYKRLRILMLAYSAAIFSGTLISMGIFFKGELIDIREISPFISSIRFGLNISFAFFALLYFIFFDNYFKIWHKIVFTVLATWFVVFLFILESVTALGIILVIGVSYLVVELFRTRYYYLKTAFIVLAVGIPLSLFLYIRHTVQLATHVPPVNFEELDKYTALGNPYLNDTSHSNIEDGRYIGLYISYKELAEAWAKRSDLSIGDATSNGQIVRETLVRYLTSKDLRKDAAGVEALTDRDIHMIEQGVANYNYLKYPGLRVRILKILMGYTVYKKTGDPSGSSVMQRIEYSKAAFDLIREHFWLGVGTGDLEDALNSQYKKMGSELKIRYRFHAHNQFLAIFIAFGVFGFLWFIIALLYPPIKIKRFGDYFFVTFFLVAIFSMLSDDTLETQAGVTFFAFFYTFLLFGKKNDNALTQSGKPDKPISDNK